MTILWPVLLHRAVIKNYTMSASVTQGGHNKRFYPVTMDVDRVGAAPCHGAMRVVCWVHGASSMAGSLSDRQSDYHQDAARGAKT